MKAVWATALLVMILGVVGCSDSSPAESDDTDPGRTATPFDDAIAQVSVEWGDCSDLETSGQCAAVAVPLFWDGSRTEQISIAALRKPERPEEFSAQLWVLDGGPGSPGTANLPGLFDWVLLFDSGLELFTLDHRGTGSSFYLGCEGDEYTDLAGDCRTYVEDTYDDWLPAFSTTHAAIDLAALIEANRREDVPVYVLGISYGTYLAHRFLQIFPDWVDGVILDGIAAPDSTFLKQNEHVDRVAAELFERCAADAFCGDKLGTDPYGRVAGALAQMEQGHCSELGAEIDAEFIRGIAVDMLYSRPLNEMLPALFYRLERCSADDVAVWQSVISLLGFGDSLDTPQQAPDQPAGGFSRVLYANVALSELWAHPQWSSPEEMQTYLTETDENAVLGFSGQQALHDSWLVWPTYDDATYDNKWAETETPLLMLQGKLDPATVWDQARPVGDWFNGPEQYFVTFPNAAHGTLVGTPRTDGYPDCGLKMALDFIDDPTVAPNDTCIGRIFPLDFSGENIPHDVLTGTNDLWGDAEAAPTLLRTGAQTQTGSFQRSPAEIERAMTEAQRRRQISRF